ncbi:hypothetical protein U0070_012744 [Myodes glareolus]|uniref:Glycosyl transferase family 1 domain-containing protein n=1 Tax=Myodes glareolus TaxID=447135 RepID=A0AAW0JRB0_MYOGA
MGKFPLPPLLPIPSRSPHSLSSSLTIPKSSQGFLPCGTSKFLPPPSRSRKIVGGILVLAPAHLFLQMLSNGSSLRWVFYGLVWRVDPAFTREVKDRVRRAAGVRLIREMCQEDLHAVVKSCFALVNSSVSEGMSAAILEAMDLEVPVLARNIPGNSAVVEHGVTGLLFTTPQAQRSVESFGTQVCGRYNGIPESEQNRAALWEQVLAGEYPGSQQVSEVSLGGCPWAATGRIMLEAKKGYSLNQQQSLRWKETLRLPECAPTWKSFAMDAGDGTQVLMFTRQALS